MVATYPIASPNGTAALGMDPAAAAALLAPSSEEILEMVSTHETDTQALRTRMYNDYKLYRLTKHVNVDPVDEEVLKNYATFTTNSPRVFADKVISWLSQAELVIRIPHIIETQTHKPEVDNLKERFAIGCLAAADERLTRRLDPNLRGMLSTAVTVRGGYIGGRALLVNRPDGSSYPDVCAWDPAHIHWGVNADGLEWAAYKIKRTAAQMRREYPGIKLPESSRRAQSIDTQKEGMWVVDYYDANINTLLIDGKTAKPPTFHGSPRVPCYLGLVGPWPILQSETDGNLIADVGESIYAGVREIYEKKSDIMSIFLEIVSRARRQTVITESADGKKKLPFDPFRQGTEIGIRTGEKIYTLSLQQMAQETMAYLTAVLGEEQRATLPFSSYGETPFQLSGYAITQLRQATETVLASRLEALESAYSQISNLLHDQFMTGAFSGMKLSGRDRNRNYFNMMITPQALVETCDFTIKLTSQLPQDNAAKWQQAAIAKETGLFSDEDILDNVLEVQDSQATMDKMKTQLAKQALPEAQLYDLMNAAADRGDFETAKMYLAEYSRLIAVKMGIMPDMGDGGPAGGQGAGGKGKGMTPDVLPAAGAGMAPQPETSNDGPSRIAPRTPRPRARSQKA